MYSHLCNNTDLRKEWYGERRAATTKPDLITCIDNYFVPVMKESQTVDTNPKDYSLFSVFCLFVLFLSFPHKGAVLVYLYLPEK